MEWNGMEWNNELNTTFSVLLSNRPNRPNRPNASPFFPHK